MTMPLEYLKRFRDLQAKADANGLSTDEVAELADLTERIHAAELEQLRPAMERIQREAALSDARNAELDRLLQREQALAHKLEKVLAEAQAEHRAILEDLDRTLAGSAPGVITRAPTG